MRGASGDDPDGPDDVVDGGDPTEPTSESTNTAEVGESNTDPDDADTGTDATVAGSGSASRDLAESDPNAATDTAAVSQIDPSKLTVSERSLHPRTRILWIVRATIWALVLGAIAFAATWQWLEIGPILPAAITTILLVLFVTHAILRYRAWQYEFREDAIYLERGVLTRVRTVVPFVRIQHVDTARGPIERAAGLSTLVVYTAGSRGADVTIPGIEAERATDHQRRLKQLAIAAEDDTAV